MPRAKLTKSVIDDLPTPAKDIVYWDAACPGFGVKVTPAGRKVFVVLYRTGGAGSRLRKYTIGPYGSVTLHQARVSAQKVFAAKQVCMVWPTIVGCDSVPWSDSGDRAWLANLRLRRRRIK